jgi:hypothetical protein
MDEVELRHGYDGNPCHEVLQHFERQCSPGTDSGALLRRLPPVFRLSYASVGHGIDELVETPRGNADCLDICVGRGGEPVVRMSD